MTSPHLRASLPTPRSSHPHLSVGSLQQPPYQFPYSGSARLSLSSTQQPVDLLTGLYFSLNTSSPSQRKAQVPTVAPNGCPARTRPPYHSPSGQASSCLRASAQGLPSLEHFLSQILWVFIPMPASHQGTTQNLSKLAFPVPFPALFFSQHRVASHMSLFISLHQNVNSTSAEGGFLFLWVFLVTTVSPAPKTE